MSMTLVSISLACALAAIALIGVTALALFWSVAILVAGFVAATVAIVLAGIGPCRGG